MRTPCSLRLFLSLALLVTVAVSGCDGSLENVGGDASNPGADLGPGNDTGPGGNDDANLADSPVFSDTYTGADATDPGGEACMTMERFFMREVWPKVAVPSCLGCHNPQGISAGSSFIMVTEQGYSDYLERNIESMTRVARQRLADHDNQSKLLLKPTNTIDHEGGRALAVGDARYKILEEFVHRVDNPVACPPEDVADFFEGVIHLSPAEHARKTSLSLAGRLPTSAELAAVDAQPEAGINALLDAIYTEDGFYNRLKEGFNDVFLTDFALAAGFDGRLYEPHYPDRRWWEALGLSDSESTRLRNHSRYGISREPLELIAFIVRNDRPFTELLTANYIMVNPYSARSYGVFGKVDFDDPENRDEFQPTQLASLSNEGDSYPHAGMLSSYVFLNRYPSTTTNRNRHRAAMFLEKFLATNILEAAPLSIDPTEAVHYFNPVMDAPDCTVCHTVMDPIAGAFQAYNDSGQYRPRTGGWFRDMYSPGFNSQLLPPTRMWEGVRWLGEQASKDRRFDIAMVQHAFSFVTGQKPIELPRDVDSDDYYAQLRAYEVQRQFLQESTRAFVTSDYDFKALLRTIVHSPYYRAANAEAELLDAERKRELGALGTARLLSPEALSRKITAIFNNAWLIANRDALTDTQRYYFLFGGIDSDLTTERLSEPNGIIGGIATMMANDVACKNSALDFTRDPLERVLFPFVEITDVAGTDAETDARIKRTIQHLHQRVLGESLDINDVEIEASFDLFKDVVQDGQAGLAQSQPGYAVALQTACRGAGTLRNDPDYTIRGWTAVVAYLLSAYEFLYE